MKDYKNITISITRAFKQYEPVRVELSYDNTDGLGEDMKRIMGDFDRCFAELGHRYYGVELKREGREKRRVEKEKRSGVAMSRLELEGNRNEQKSVGRDKKSAGTDGNGIEMELEKEERIISRPEMEKNGTEEAKSRQEQRRKRGRPKKKRERSSGEMAKSRKDTSGNSGEEKSRTGEEKNRSVEEQVTNYYLDGKEKAVIEQLCSDRVEELAEREGKREEVMKYNDGEWESYVYTWINNVLDLPGDNREITNTQAIKLRKFIGKSL